MTEWDVRNYLEKIYKITNIVQIRSKVECGEIKRAKSKKEPYLVKEPDYRRCYVALVNFSKDEFVANFNFV